jgi:site-specific DNA-methyltransferase (adenine-specific)
MNEVSQKMINITNEDNMAMMARYPDKYFELAIVDPPYGIGAGNVKRGGQQHGNSLAPSKEYDKKDWDNKPPPPEYFQELFRVSKNQIIWGGNY